MAIEEPAYTVLRSEDSYELRQYQAYLVAQTLVDGSFDGVGSEAFNRLFAYISGANRAERKIPMTAPVNQEAVSLAAVSEKIPMTAPVEQQRSGQRWRVAFVLPPTYSVESAPQPTDPRIAIARIPARRVAVVRYRGTWSESRYAAQLAGLRDWIGRQGLTAAGEPVFARYDPPFMPWFLRRNEIQIPLVDPPPSPPDAP